MPDDFDLLISHKSNRPAADTYGGVRDWWKKTFNSDIPVRNVGASDFERRAGHEHSRAFDVGLNPNSAQGQQLIKYLKSQGIPYSAFDRPITKDGRIIATGPHIHVGIPSPNLGIAPATDDFGKLVKQKDDFDTLLQQKSGTKTASPTKSPYAKPGSYTTQLSPDQERAFQEWVKKNRVPWRDSPTADYDMRGYYKALQSGDPQAKQQLSGFDKSMHFPDTYKTPYHKTFSNESKYALPNAPHWVGDKLMDAQGNVLADETPQQPPKIKGDYLNQAVDQAKARDAFVKDFPYHLDWHLGVPANVASWWFNQLPKDKQQQVATEVAQAVAQDEVKKAQGVKLTRDPAYQKSMRDKLKVFYAPSASQGQSPSIQAAGASDDARMAAMSLPRRMLTEAIQQGFAGLAEAYGGATRLLAGGTEQHPLTPEEDWKIAPGGVAASEWAKRQKAGVARAEQIKPMPKVARLATTLGAGAIEYAPLAAVPEAGLESIFARMAVSGVAGGAYTGLQAMGREEKSSDVAKQAEIGAAEFSLFGAPKVGKPLTKEAETALNKTLFRRAASNVILTTGVGGGVALIEKSTGKSWSDAAAQGFALAALRHGGDLVKLVKVRDPKTGEIRPATPELIEALAKKEAFQEKPPLSPEAPQLNAVRLRELNQAIQKAESDLKIVKFSKGGRTTHSTKLENTIAKRIVDLTRERNQIMDRGPRRTFDSEPKRAVDVRARMVGQQVPPLTKATEPIASRFPSALESPLGEAAPGEPSELSSLNLSQLQTEFNRLKETKNRTPAQKLTMGVLKNRIAAQEKAILEPPNVSRETVTAGGTRVRQTSDVEQPSMKVSDPAVGDVEVPIWQQLSDERGFLNLGDIMQAIDDLRKKYPKFGEAALRAMAISRLERERAAGASTERGTWQQGQVLPEASQGHKEELQSKFGTPRQPMTRDQLIDHIQSQNAGQSAGVLAERLSSGQYERTEVPVTSLSAPYVQPHPTYTGRSSSRGASATIDVVVNEKGEVVAGQHQLRDAQASGKTSIKVWKPVGVELKPPEPWTGGQPDWTPEKRAAQPGVKVKRAGEPVAPVKPATAPPAAEAKPTGTTEPGTERYVLGVQKGQGGWHYAVRDTQFPNMPPKTAGPFPTRDAAIARGGAHATRLNKQGEAGFVNVGDAFEAVGDFFKGLPKEISKDLYAATIKTLQSHEAAQAEMGTTRSQVFDNTFEAAEVAAQRLPPQILQDIILTRGKAETPAGQKLQAEAAQRLNAVSNPYLKGMVDTMRRTVQEGYDTVHKYATSRGVNVAYRPDYFYGVWDSPRVDVDNFIETWRTTERYKKQKAIPTVADGMGYGLKLADSNPFSNIRRELTDIERRQSMKELADHLRTLPNTAKEISKLPFDQLQRLKADGWMPLGDPAFQGLLIEPKYAKYLDNVLATNFMSTKKPLKAMREVSRTLQKAKFIGSIFHFKNIVKASIATEVGGAFNPAGYKDALYSAMKGAFDLRKAGIDPLSPEHLEYVKLSGGHTRAMETEGARAFGQELNVLIERALTPRIGEAGAKVGESVRKASTAIPGLPGFQRWLFNNYIPALKEIKYFRDLASEEKAKGRSLTDYEKIDIVKRNQNFYGEMNERLFGRSAGMTSALRIPFTAPGFGEGNLRTMARAIKEPVEALGKLKRGEKLTKMDIRSAQFMIQSWMISALTAQLTTRLLTGNWATPKTIREMFLVNTGENDKDGAPIYFDTLSYDKDYWTALGFMANATGMPKSWKQYAGVQPTLGKASNEILQRVAGAEAPAMGALGMIADLINHRQIFDWRGRPILREGDTHHNLKAIGDQLADRFEPIMISTVRQAMSAGLPPAKSIIYSTMGVRPVRMPGIFQLAHDFNVDSGHPPTGVFEPSEYQGLTDTLGRPEAQTAFDELHKSKSRGQILKYYHDRTTRPLTGNKEREEKFKQSLSPDQLQWYEEEYAKRKRDLQQIEQLIELRAPARKLTAPTAKKPSIYQTP